MGIVRLGPPEPLVLALRDALGAKTFIETGTYRGATAEWASRQFDSVHSIELAEPLYREALENLGSISNLELHLGDTRSILPDLIRDLSAPAVIWLDAHWSGGKTSGETDQCPLLDELKIADRATEPLALLVDDARLFLSAPPEPLNLDDWPDMTDVVETLSRGRERYVAVTEDIVVAVPMSCRDVVVSHCRRVATESLPKKSAFRRGLRSLSKKLKKRAGRQ
jgi:hypothetical protein